MKKRDVGVLIQNNLSPVNISTIKGITYRMAATSKMVLSKKCKEKIW